MEGILPEIGIYNRCENQAVDLIPRIRCKIDVPAPDQIIHQVPVVRELTFVVIAHNDLLYLLP